MFFRMVYKSGQIFLPFCHNPRVWQTDRQTDRRTDGRTDRILIAIPRLHYMQRGKKWTECDWTAIKLVCLTDHQAVTVHVMQAGSDAGKARCVDGKQGQQREAEDDCCCSPVAYWDTGAVQFVACWNSSQLVRCSFGLLPKFRRWRQGMNINVVVIKKL